MAAGQIERTVVILSTGRTGTMTLAKYLDACAEVTARHEPKPSRLLRIASGRRLAGRLPDDAMRQRLKRARRRLLSEVSTPIYVESNWYLYGFLDVLRDVFPGVRVVHVVRDPRTLIPSYINFGTFRFPKSLLVNYVPFWYLRPEQRDPAAVRRWAAMSAAERLAFHWATVNEELDRAAGLYEADYLRVKYEDLFAPDGSCLQELVEFAGIGAVPKDRDGLAIPKMNASRQATFPHWAEWADVDRENVMSICSGLMQQYGYTDALPA